MTCSATTPRLLFTLSSLALLTACPGPPADDGSDSTAETTDTGDTGDVSSCVDPGSEVLPDIKPVLEPNPQQSPDYTCTTGWATDAPWLEPAWTKQIGAPELAYYGYPMLLEGHPDGGVISAGASKLARYSNAGDELWSVDIGTGQETQYWLTVEQSGSIVLGTYNWNVDQTTIDRYDADGGLIAPINVMWNSSYASIWALETYGSDLVIGAFDEDEQGFYEATLLRLDASDNVVLRKSTSQSGGQIFAVNDAGTVMFGSFPGYLVSLDNGAVLGTWTPSSGSSSMAIGYGDDFAMTGGNSDLTIGRYSGIGVETWLQAYDRATLTEQGLALAVGDDGTIVSVGTTTVLNFSNTYWFGTQPIVIASDADGNALWADRMAAHGLASSVAVGSEGEVYVTGIAELDGDPNGEPMVVRFLRMYRA